MRITNAQRAALILDIVFLWLLRPPILADLSVKSFGRARLFNRALRDVGLVLAGVISIAALWFSVVVATIPGEWQETALAALDRPRWKVAYAEFGEEKPSSFRLMISCSRAMWTTRLEGAKACSQTLWYCRGSISMKL